MKRMFEMQQLANVPYRLQCGHSKLVSFQLQTVSHGTRQFSILELAHKPASQGNLALSLALSDANLPTIVQQPSRHFALNLAKIPPNQVIADVGRGSSLESESE